MKSTRKAASIIAAAVIVSLTGCATGADLRANVYDAGQVNHAQAVQTVQIIAIQDAKVKADNSQNAANVHTAAVVGGALLGAFLGAHSHNVAAGALIGGAAGHVGGSLAPDQVLVDGVTITFATNGQTLSSTQVGRSCEYKPGIASVISTQANETRIQPNASCPS